MGNKYIYQNVKVGRAGVSFKINGTAKSNSVPLSNENRTFGIALNIYYNNSSTPEFHYQNFSADTDSYQQVSLSVTPEKTNEVVNYIAFAFVYGYNENEMTVDNAEVNISPLIQSSEDSKNETSEKEAVDEEVLSESIDKSKPYMQTSSEYDSTGNYVTSETNEQGSTTQHAYDANGNITEIKQNGKLTNKYVYDSLNELKEEYDYVNKFYINYSYDGAGNLQNKYEQALDPNYGYPTGTQNGNTYEYTDTSWKDKLTKINGDNITYDANGNPLTYRDGMSMTWKSGRQLTTLTNGDTSISYGYDSDSVRTTKTVNGVKYTYAYLNGQLLYETRGDAKFYYSYDANGILYNVRYTLTDGGTEYSYYYTHNSRGDIVGIYNGVGELKAHYEYDAWGNVISITDNNGNAITNPNHIGNLNPFRYRGYYQDTETGLYYLMSRYYDAVTHRFINADGYFQAGTSILDGNTFAYCANNPIYSSDPTGSSIIFGALIGGATEFFGQIISGKSIDEVDWGSVFVSAGTGAILGAVDVLGVGAVAGVLIKGGVSFTGSFIKYSMQGEDFNLAVQHSAVDGLLTMGFASISNVFKTSSGNHYNYNVNNSNQRVNRWSTSIENVVDNSRSFKPKVYAPSKPKPVPKKQTQCRSCGRPIGNKYWQCSSPSYY